MGCDFNRHHPWWESEDNTYLTSAEHMVSPILDLTARYDLQMALPPNVPTLQAFSTSNWTRPNNVWCSRQTLDHFTRCTTNPGSRPPNTDHLPVRMTLDMSLPVSAAKTTRNFRSTDWKEFRKHFEATLATAPEPARIRTLEEFRDALDILNGALRMTIETEIPENKPTPYTKRWWTPELTAARRRKHRLANLAHKWRGLPDHHSHADHKSATKEYVQLIETTKQSHWEAWLMAAADRDLWTANKYATDPPTDGGKSRMPTLKRASADGSTQQATSNKDKTNALAKSLFPPPPPNPTIPHTCYPKPTDEYFHFFTRMQIRQVASKLGAHKAPGPDGIPNVVLKQCIEGMIDHLYFIFRAIFELGVYPDEWRELITVVLRKPGKPSYEDPKAYQPIALLNTLGKLFSTIAADELSYLCKTRDCQGHSAPCAPRPELDTTQAGVETQLGYPCRTSTVHRMRKGNCRSNYR